MSPANVNDNSFGINLASDKIDQEVHPRVTSNDQDAVHILVLETDEPHPETRDRKGSFSDIFHDLFTKAGAAHNPPLKVTTSDHYIVDDPDNDHHGSVPSISEVPRSCHAILITGSMYDAHGEDKWVLQLIDLLTELWKTRPAMLFSGVCFGHQILARMLGSKVQGTPSGR